jgi:2-polyprenyl-3-methyl-5-hydroxy-6-metoxy-1,4-benzoquinol methylase
MCVLLLCVRHIPVYGTAMSGRCAKKQELADTALDLSASLFTLPCRGGDILPELLFDPLGYEVHAEETALLDEQFSEWGNSPYINLTIRRKVLLRDLLNHAYALIPVFDRQKHCWIGEDEIDKFLSHGRGWLPDHPEKKLIARWYFKNLRTLAQTALDRLDNGEGAAEVFSPGESPAAGEALFFSVEENTAETDGIAAGLKAVDAVDQDESTTTTANVADDDKQKKITRPKLNTRRLEAVLDVIKRSGAESVIDLGCGEGNLLRLLIKEKTIRPMLNTRRLEAVLDVIKRSGAESVIDLGCGEGNLLRLLVKEKTFTRIAGVDVSRLALERARDKLKLDRLPDARKNRISLFQGSLTYRDKRFRGYDAAALVEVIEHLEENRLDTLAAVVFGDARPGMVVISTPNVEYNELYGISRFRHEDHRFEWSRARFQSWAEEVARRYAYEVSFADIGELDERLGAPTQMGVFERSGLSRSSPCA